MDKTGDKIKK